MDGTWTLAELVERAALALAVADVRAPNGRVTEVPDGRMIRWYATTGLVDRPAMRGRVAHYGQRHLLQLVAVKRLQAAGLTLAEIQQRLAGATDSTLRRVAAMPPGVATAAPDVPTPAEPEPAKTAPAGSEPALSEPTPALSEPGPVESDGVLADVPASESMIRPPDRAKPRPDRAKPQPDPARPARPGRPPRFWATPAAASGSRPPILPTIVDRGADDTDAVLYGLRLDGATVLLRAMPRDEDLPAIRETARPLLELLAARGLLAPAANPEPRTADRTEKGEPA